MSFTIAPSIELFQHTGIGNVEESIALSQKGWVAFEGTSWSARFYQGQNQAPINPGEQVAIVGRDGNTLLVMPIDSQTS